jgi:small subunit ribosomal protein S6e
VKQGENNILGLMDDVRNYIVRREVKSAKKENAKPYTKA